MARVYISIDPKAKGSEEILLRHAVGGGKEGQVFVNLHPRWARLLDLMWEEAEIIGVVVESRREHR